ncbi:NAD(P)H:quinone oxidoreductase [Oceanidesulfovibrio indonesiensis]|uniref:NAD(P)H:quinone oxidoreductase n=1 Tax=Oceanidesulfovibrio indonesiensis TaxID=54767 RepID=A0A7M3MCW2_9BACT|nr:NAD(P)H:quinone oxidoreductase [Oceanidesulfovibrio indonesiensis]
MKAYIVYYSMYGHIHTMAQAARDAAQDVEGWTAELRRVPETLPDEVLEKMGALDAKKLMADVTTAQPSDLEEADAIIFGTPTRFGNMAAQMKAFIDHLGGLWTRHALVGKPATVFTSSNTQHGGQESTILTFHVPLYHLGMVLVGLPYTFTGQRTMDEITGCSPYGASTIAGMDGSRMPSQNELDGVRHQTRHLLEIATKLAK